MNKIRVIAAAIAKSFNGLRPNWAILSVWAGMEVFVSAYFGWNMFWGSDAELFADLILLVVFAIGLYAPAAPVYNTYVNNHFKDSADDEETFEEKYGSGCQGYGCDEGCDDCKTDDDSAVDTDQDHMEDDEPIVTERRA